MKFLRLRPGRFLRNVGWEMLAEMGSAAAMLLSFLLVAPRLGDGGFGVYSGTFALMLVLGPLASWGAGPLLVRAVNSDGEDVRTALARIGRLNVVSILGVAAIALVLEPILLPQAPKGAFLALLLGELVLGRVIVLYRHVAQATERLRLSAITFLASRLSRLLFAIGFWLSSSGDLVTWSWLHAASNLVGVGVGSVVIARWGLGPSGAGWPTRRDTKDGVLFALGGNASFVKNDIDKTLLLRMNFEQAAGEYASGYRLVTAVSQPLLAFLGASSARFFRTATDSAKASLQLTLKMSGWATFYAALAGTVMWLGAPLAEVVLGGQFDETASVIRWLAVLPAIVAGQQFAGQALTAHGLQGQVVVMVSASAVVNVAMNLALIPSYEWRGAVIATVVTELLLTGAFWARLLRVRDTPAAVVTPEEMNVDV